MADPNVELRGRIIQDWRAAAAGWRRWEPQIVAMAQPVTLRMLEAMRLESGNRVLDVGCGFGDPTLAIADRVGEEGRVTAIEPAEEMVATGRQRAKSLGAENVAFESIAVEEFEAAPGSFDAVSGRWSFIFCTDVRETFRRVRGWMTPGGRIAVATWRPQAECPGFAAINTALNRQVALPTLDSTKPSMVQLSEPGQLEAALAAGGFRAIGVEPVRLSIVMRDGEEFWQMMTEMGGSLRRTLASLTPEQIEAARRDVVAAVSEFSDGAVLRIPAVAQVGWGEA